MKNFTLLFSALLLTAFGWQANAQGDNCLAALAVTPGLYTADGPATGAGSVNATNADWYSYTPLATGTIDISACSGPDTRLYVYDGTCAALVEIASNDDACGLGSEIIGTPVVGGTTYYFEFDDQWSTAGFDWSFIFSAAAIPGDCFSSGSYDYVSNSTMASSLQSFVANTPGDYITLTFSAGSTETGWDYWFINDAADGTGTTIATGDGPITGAYESATGEISFYVESDGGVQGTTFVYDLACSPPPSCATPSLLDVTNLTTSSADLVWTAGGTETMWDLEYGVAPYTPTGTPTVSGATNPYNYSGLTANTTYEFYVRADCGGGQSVWAGPYSFFTGYCVPSSSSADTYVDNFSTSNGVTNISNLISGFTAGGYADATAQAVESFATGTFDFNAEIVGGTAGFSIWVDWNNDLVFDNVTEKVFNTTAYGSGPFTGTITIPALTAIGDYRMRISTDWNQSNPSNPCGAQTRAEFEDYTITVGNPPSCVSPSALTATNITSSSADLGWTANGTETMWDLEYGVAPYAPTGTPTVSGVTNPYNYSGLTASATYEFYVRADCGGANGVSSWTGPFSFTTSFACPAGAECASLAGEVSTDYDFTALGGVSTCPGLLSVTIPAGNIVDSVTTFYDMTAGAGAYMSEQRSWLYSPTVAAGEAALSQGVGAGGGTMSYNRTGISFANTATGTVDFELHAGRTWGGAGCDNTYNKVDAGTWTVVVYHSLAPSCSQPSSLTVTNITGASADLGWTATGTETMWNIQYGPAGFTPGTGTIVAAGTNPYTLTGLTSSTSYDFWIQADCGADSSAYAGPSSFTTPFVCPAGAECASLAGEVSTDFDFTALGGVSTCPGLLSVTIPAGNIVDSVTTFYDMTAGVGASGGAWISEQRSWLYSPTVAAGEATLSQGVGGGGGTMSYNRTGISFANTATGTVDFELHAGRTWGGAGCDNTYNKVDAGTWTVVVYHSLAPSCFNPTALNATSVTSTSANLEWTAGSNETQWNLEYGPAGFTPGTGTVANAVTTNPYAITGLNGNTAYDFYVQADCGANGTSNMAGPGTFTTLCTAFTLPWSENFDAGTTTPTCWSQGSANAEDWLFEAAGGHVGNAGVIGGATTSGNNFAWIDDSTPDNTGTTLESPLVDVSSLAVPMLSFYLISNNEGNGGTNVNFSVDVWDGAAWNVGVYTSNSNTLNGEWQQISVVLSSLTITGPIQLKFIVDEDPTSAYFDDVAIDDVTFVEAPACPDPTLLSAANITTTSADLGWTENGTATTWDIEYGMAPYTATGTPTIAGTITNPNNLTGLTSGTTYEFYVRADCGGTSGMSEWVGPFSFSTASDYCAGDHFYDNGGLGGNYLNNSNDTTVICPGTPGEVVEVIFNSFDTEGGYDSLAIYNGNGTSGTNLGTFDGNTVIPGPFVSTDVTGCLTFVFYSDGSVDAPGWDATITCLPPCAGLAVDLGADTALCSGQDSLMLDAGAGPYTYAWSNMASTQTITVSDANVGTIDYSVVITDSISMCTATDMISISYGDCSGISELSGSTVSVYPNPSNGNFIVSLSNIREQVSVQVVDMQGRIIYSQAEGLKVGKENVMSLDNIERGVYLISVSSEKGRYTQSIVIE